MVGCWIAEELVKGSRANLAGAYLAHPTLAHATLAHANLADAYLAGANLAGANLAGANLADANLADANLADAYLARAHLAGAYLAHATLAGATLAGASLARANLAGAYLADARGLAQSVPPDPVEPYVYGGATKDYPARAAKFRQRHPDVPIVEKLDRKILAAIEQGGRLNMSQWHSCSTTHCRAGWAIALAGDAGRKLEAEVGPHRAGFLIYGCSTGRIPHFFDTNERALEDIRKCAEEPETGSPPVAI